jgi:hypothetical protein
VGCDVLIGEHLKTAMLEDGAWRASAVSSVPATIGFLL